MSKVFIEETTLTAIGDAIREKTGKAELIAPLSMATEISSITTGGGGGGDLPDEVFTITGNCRNRFANDGWNWFIRDYGDKITTKDITIAQEMFQNSTELTSIPFKLNFIYSNNNHLTLSGMFQYCSKLTDLPEMGSISISSLANIFNGCSNLREIPEHFYKNLDFSYMSSQTSNSYTGELAYMIFGCSSLRKVPNELFASGNPACAYYYSYLNNLATRCYSLDELVNLPLYFTAEWTSNGFTNSFLNCGRLKNLTFETNPDGSPKVMKWKSQTISLYDCVGYVGAVESNVLNYNSGITVDKRIDDDATYQALKDDPDAYTPRMAYSRYNRTSAVATINTLPDTSAYLAQKGGTNTIIFQGGAGSLTDGGAINTMTEEEIAVATAKGWTVSFY